MSTGLVILVAVLILLSLLAIETPVAFALAASGTVGLIMLQGTSYASAVLTTVPLLATSRFAFTIVPMFVLMGIFGVHGRIAEQVFIVANHLFRRVPGGLGCATIAACAGFAAVTGSSVATAATMARLSIDHMLSYGYPRRLAGGLVAASGTLGVLIPPSIILIIYAILTGESTGALLAAGIIPGFLTATFYVAYVVLVGSKRVVAPDPVAVQASIERTAQGIDALIDQSRAEREAKVAVRLRDLPWRGVFRVGVLALIVLGGIYSGVFTATESGALGALAALLFMIWELRREGVRTILSRVRAALLETSQTTSMVFTIVVGSVIFARFLTVSQVPQKLTEFVVALPLEPWVIVLLLLLSMIPLGMALESLSILVITMPLIYPAVIALGFDGVWFGILVVKMIEIGLVTPPVGIAVYVTAGSSSLEPEEIFAGVWPFILMDLLVIVVLFMFPQVVLFLPNFVSN